MSIYENEIFKDENLMKKASGFDDDIVCARFFKYMNKALNNVKNKYIRDNLNDEWQEDLYFYDEFDQIPGYISECVEDYVIDKYEKSDGKTKIKFAMNSLSNKQKEAINLYYSDDKHTNMSAAMKMGISEVAFRKLKDRALEKMNKTIQKSKYKEGDINE